MSTFLTFWLFSMKPVDFERVFGSVTMQVDAMVSVDDCDSKTAPDSSLFWFRVTAC